METEAQLRLVPLEMGHLPQIMRWVNDREVMQYFANHQQTITEAEEYDYLRTILSSKHDRVYSIFAGDEYVGQCSLNAIYWPARTARLFIVILPQFQGKGYGPEAIRQLIKASEHEIHKIWLIVREDNRDAQAMYLKLGFQFEGVLREEYCVNGQYFDMVRMAILLRPERDN